MAIDLAFFQHVLAHGVISIVFLFVGFSILKRHKHRVAQTMASFFLFVGFGLGICVILRTNSDPNVSAFGSYLGYSTAIAGLAGFFFFDLLIWKSSNKITIKKQIFFSLLYWIAILPVLIPNNWAQLWIEYPKGSNIGNPVINLTYFIYAVILGQSMIVSTMIMTKIIAKEIYDPELKKKFIQTNIGIILMDWILIGNLIFDLINQPWGRILFLLTGVVVIPGAVFLYRGMVLRPLEQENKN